MSIRDDIVKEARTYLGTPFVHQGRLKGKGIDCIGLIADVGKTLNLINYDNTTYSRQPDGKFLLAEMNKIFEVVETDKMQSGDIVLFWVKNLKYPQHVGILTDYGFIHTNSYVGKVVEHRLAEEHRKRIVKVYKYPGVD